jgi:hypothetical protein
MNLLARLRGSHTPDVEALSALADARLAPDAAGELEAHVAGCAVCSARLADLRSMKAKLASMPQADVPRSFRLSRADIREARARAAAQSPLRWAPALSGVAAALFIAVLAADVSTDGGGDGDSASESAGLGRVANGPPMPEAASRNESAFDSSVETPATAAAGAVAPMDGDAEQGGGEAADSAAPPNCDALESSPEREALETCAPSTGMTQIDDAAERASAEQTRQADLYAANAPVSDEDDGNRTGFRVVEIVAAIVAVGAAVAYVATRGRKLGSGR